jgi:hypothetical protein
MRILTIMFVSGMMMSATAALSLDNIDAANHSRAQVAKLYELQAAFHRTGSVHDPLNGDSESVIDGRIRQMLALWTKNGSLTLQAGGPRDGNYVGQGDPEDALTCPTPSTDPENRGTLCTFFKYVAGSFQPANKLVSLAPSYSTRFQLHGDIATVYFECHFFNVSPDPVTGVPLWRAASHLAFIGLAEENAGRWRFSRVTIPVTGVPIP